MSAFLSTTTAPRLDLTILRRDSFDGFTLLLQDANGRPFDLSLVTVCASIWKITGDTTLTKIVDFNTERQEPLAAGNVRFWLTSAQTNTVWESLDALSPQFVFFPSAYTADFQDTFSTLYWDARIELQEELAPLVQVSGGTFVTQGRHTLGATDRAIFKNTRQESINYDNSSGTIYSSLTNISYSSPHSFTIASLSGLTDIAIGGSVYRLKQDTVAAGAVTVGSTAANCFP
jgi:hypothetical protein